MKTIKPDDSGFNVTLEHLEELKRLLAAASGSSAPDALRPVLEYTQWIHAGGTSESRGAQA